MPPLEDLECTGVTVGYTVMVWTPEERLESPWLTSEDTISEDIRWEHGGLHSADSLVCLLTLTENKVRP